MSHKGVAASVVLYNTPFTQLSRLLNDIEHAKIFQFVYLIDNSPVPIECDLYHLPWVTYIRSESNVGYGAGHNIALRQTILSSEFHFVLNPDIYFEPEELHKMIVRMKEDDSIGQLMPRVIYPDGSLQYLCKLIPTPVDLLFRRFLRGPLKELARRKAEQFELRFTGYNREMDIPYLSGCFMLFRISALKKIGLFDERFFMYPEDIDITRRMHSEYRTIFFPGATIVHDHAKESYKSKKMLWIHLTNLIRYFNKWGWLFDAERKKVNAWTLKSLKE
jgi:GT2 family glycosyltransferase